LELQTLVVSALVNCLDGDRPDWRQLATDKDTLDIDSRRYSHPHLDGLFCVRLASANEAQWHFGTLSATGIRFNS
jgi:hypothetical protein